MVIRGRWSGLGALHGQVSACQKFSNAVDLCAPGGRGKVNVLQTLVANQDEIPGILQPNIRSHLVHSWAGS